MQRPPPPTASTNLRSNNNNNSNNYVWNEPPGRMKKILDMIRMHEKRLDGMKTRTLPKINDVCKRIRISNNALVSRMGTLEVSFQVCSVGMKQFRIKMEIVCLQHNISQYKLIPKRRKYTFPSQEKDEYNETDKNETLTITASTTNADNTNNNESDENQQQSTASSTAEEEDTDTSNNNNDTDDNDDTITASPLFKFQRDIGKYEKPNTINPLLTELLRFDK